MSKGIGRLTEYKVLAGPFGAWFARITMQRQVGKFGVLPSPP